jgi:hypothetical protein
MSFDHFLDRVPIWAFIIFVEVITLAPLEFGQRMGARRQRNPNHEPEGPVGNVVGATLVLLGFMVALTLGAATSRFDARKEALIDGVNAIESAYRDAGLLPDPHPAEVRALLREYVEVRLEMPSLYHDPDRLRQLDARVRVLQQSLWSHAQALAIADRNSEIYALFASSLNEVFRVHNKRVILGAQFRIPFLVWAVLVIVTMVSMFGVGFQFGLAGNRSLIANAVLALTFALVMVIIFDLDQSGRGVINVSQQPMYDLRERMRASP